MLLSVSRDQLVIDADERKRQQLERAAFRRSNMTAEQKHQELYKALERRRRRTEAVRDREQGAGSQSANPEKQLENSEADAN